MLLAVVLANPSADAAPGGGITLSGFAGVGYLLSSDRSGSQSHFDFAAGLSVRGGLIDPGLLRWYLGATYLGARAFGFGGVSGANAITFQGNVSAFSRLPVMVSLNAERTFADASTGSGTAQLTGYSGVTALGAEAVFRRHSLPSAALGLRRTMVDTTQYTGTTAFAGSTRLTASIGQSLPALDYGVAYEAAWDDGTYASQNYRSHSVRAQLAAALSSNLRFNIVDSYFLRLPSNQLPGSLRLDSNQLGAGLQWQPSTRLTASLNYGYQLATFAAPGQPSIESLGQSLSESVQHQLLKGLWLRETLAARYARTTLGGTSRSGWGQDLGAGVSWERTMNWLSLSAGVDGAGGLVEPDTGGLTFSYGVGGDGRVGIALGRASGHLGYSVRYSSGGPAVFGYTIQQVAQAGARVQPGQALSLAATFNASAGRREDAFLGTYLNRALVATLSAGVRQHQLQVSGGLTDGVDAALVNPGVGGGLFLPTGYNTQTRYLQASVSSAFDRGRLGIRLGGRVGDAISPNRPREVGAGATGSVWYEIGRFRFAVEDVLNYNEIGGAVSWNNQFMVRVTRDFSFGLFGG